jgi:hypothetical protein
MTPGGNERPEASNGEKDEDMICLGRFLTVNQSTPLPAVRTMTGQEKLVRLFGGRVLGEIRGTSRPRLAWSPRR